LTDELKPGEKKQKTAEKELALIDAALEKGKRNRNNPSNRSP